MKWLNRMAPKKFLWKFSLELGSKYIAIFMCCVSVICVLVFIGEAFYRECKNCSQRLLHDVYGFSINIIIYCICMFFVNLWMIWGVAHKKPAVVLTWVVVTTMWWLQGFCLIFILLLLDIVDISIAWIVVLCITIVAFVIFGYCILVGYAYWLQIKGRSRADISADQQQIN
ncbi:unnamed protein product [Arctia plantaginis]|uniref:Uncharacterized protein n=1 Tax=Arctia plantaginis TaxID=874455 RepID=A0A8S0Z5G2_ARCPL|nr:unnamed protein product [Arctia plantaginis]